MRIVRPLSASERVTAWRNPPGGVGGELVAPAVVELLHRPDQPEGALLDEIEQGEAPADVALRDRDDESEIRFDHVLLGADVTPLYALGEGDLLLCAEEGDAADRAEVEAEGIEARLDVEIDLGSLELLQAGLDVRRRLARLVLDDVPSEGIGGSDGDVMVVRIRGARFALLGGGMKLADGLGRAHELDPVLLQITEEIAGLRDRQIGLLDCGCEHLSAQEASLLTLGDRPL